MSLPAPARASPRLLVAPKTALRADRSATWDRVQRARGNLRKRVRKTGAAATETRRSLDMYNYQRWYRAEDGRYVSPDPIGRSGGEDGYAGYANSNPLVSTDASGLERVRSHGTTHRETATGGCTPADGPYCVEVTGSRNSPGATGATPTGGASRTGEVAPPPGGSDGESQHEECRNFCANTAGTAMSPSLRQATAKALGCRCPSSRPGGYRGYQDWPDKKERESRDMSPIITPGDICRAKCWGAAAAGGAACGLLEIGPFALIVCNGAKGG